jgi:hypothetical protein
MKKLEDMTAVEVANYEFSFHPFPRKAVSVKKTGILECEIVCEDGSTVKAMGLIAHELGKAVDRDSKNVKMNFKKELKELLDRYDFDMYIDFDSLGAGGWHESLLAVENRGFDCEHISFDLDDIVERKTHR